MSYTMTFDASHKVGRGGHAKAFFRHIARDADQAAGFTFPQANRNVVPERTKLNVTLVNDGKGGYRRLTSVDGRPPSDEFDDYLQRRLGTVGRALRKDAVLIRGVILQLDPKWFVDHNPDWREAGMNREAFNYTNAALEWARSEFSEENIVGLSVHLDEYNPQLQLLISPVTQDGRLSQKDFFKGPADLKRQHQELREAVAAAGYDVEYRVTERSREHLSSREFQSKADWLRDATSAVAEDLEVSRHRSSQLARRSADLEDRETLLEGRERELDAARVIAEHAAERAEEARRRAHSAGLAAERAREEIELERDRLRRVNQRLESVPAYFDLWLDKTSINGVPVRKRFDVDLIKMRAELKHKVTATTAAPAKQQDEIER
nr:plasmid recombination protein [Microbacterium hydrocarbonoxydans]